MRSYSLGGGTNLERGLRQNEGYFQDMGALPKDAA